ncbi:unnamed protein product [Nippostrongylus brasiliensis]|uniref:Uncharacterized protein n=1 Tax=Nippostrongylus brasiliensis TaxID=27835 RepID=A0A0N4XNU7_NIPBR|nr:unnamed protein product [Nippostrongylus brasiliensis]
MAKKGESCVLKYTSPCPTDGVMITIDAMDKGNRHTRICNIKEDNVECVCRKDRCNSIDNIVAAKDSAMKFTFEVKAAPDWEMNRYMKEDLLGCLTRIKDESQREGSESGVAESDLLTGPTMMIVVIVLAVILLMLISIVILVVVCSYRKNKKKKKKNVKK